MKKWLLPILLIAMLVLAACGGGDDAAEEAPAAAEGSAQEAIAQVLDVVAGDLYFDTQDNIGNPPVWTVQAGEPFQVNLNNQGGLEHNWAIVRPGTEVPIPFDPAANADIIFWDAGLVAPGETGSDSTTIDEPGEYVVICTVAGHYPAMQGRLVVE